MYRKNNGPEGEADDRQLPLSIVLPGLAHVAGAKHCAPTFGPGCGQLIGRHVLMNLSVPRSPRTSPHPPTRA